MVEYVEVVDVIEVVRNLLSLEDEVLYAVRYETCLGRLIIERVQSWACGQPNLSRNEHAVSTVSPSSLT